MHVYVYMYVYTHVCVWMCKRRIKTWNETVSWDFKEWDKTHISCNFQIQVCMSSIPNCKFKLFGTLRITCDSVAEFICASNTGAVTPKNSFTEFIFCFLLFNSKYYCFPFSLFHWYGSHKGMSVHDTYFAMIYSLYPNRLFLSSNTVLAFKSFQSFHVLSYQKKVILNLLGQ